MTWPAPAPGEVFGRYAAGFEAAFATDPDGVPYPAPPDTRDPDSVFFVLGDVGEQTFSELYYYQSTLADELMPDTATAAPGTGWLPRHAAEWGVPRLLPLTSLGAVILAGTPGTVLPAGIEATDGTGTRWITRAGATIGESGAVQLPAEAELAGTASDIADADPAVVLQLVSPVVGVDPQTATVAPGGFVGGRDLEDVEAWRGRVLARIRSRGKAGSAADYIQWAIEAGAASAAVLPRWTGAGTVGVAVLMPGTRTPTGPELARMQAYVDDVRPVTATTTLIAATLSPVGVQLAVSPDTVATRAAVTAGLAAFFAREAAIGRVIPRSRLDEAISSASGEYAHVLALPAGNIVPAATAIPTLGAVVFTAAAGIPAPPPELV